ncbi:FtsX-like permease family protein [Herbidospora sp. NEAU-GS84]|uniref:FtsX-like permease family protein n=1 Tax=Herbidospora solisilvae TaxID=2696284 RepID=A0A7C9N2I8_9ACTN|nr:FtsX-like permease family protein [Herbidospora solisilvae]NAS24510.1 FtsX-like permease family protein [Herbidospora solisilvae]
MSSPRWNKAHRDLVLAAGRMSLLVVAIAAGISGVGSVLGTNGIVTREIDANYLGTRPAAATFDLDRVDPALVDRVRTWPGVTDAEARATVTARLRLGPDEWRTLLLTVVPDFTTMRLATVTHESGSWPPPAGTMLLERSAREMVPPGTLEVRLPGGTIRPLTVSGVVHDPSLAPAWQERSAYGYVTPETLAGLGGSPVLDELKIRTEATDRAGIEAVARDLSAWLSAQGREVHEVQVPPPGKHPHSSQMTAVMTMLLVFALLGLALAAVLTATVIGGLMAQQIRQLGVMKAIGARTGQIAGLYLAQVFLLGLIATLISLPLGTLAARTYAGLVAELLNLELGSLTIPWWVYAVQIAAGLLVPPLFAAIPIVRAARVTVREAISDFGVRNETVSARITGLNRVLLLAVRNTFRRRGRLLLTLGLLSAGGALFLAGLNVAAAWQRTADEGMASRHYDLDIRLTTPDPALTSAITALPGVRTVETWGYAPASAQTGIASTYPDGGHGSFTIRGVPEATTLLDFTLVEGRMLRPGDIDAAVLNSLAGPAKVGDTVTYSVDGKPTTWRVVGLVREIGNPATAYVTRAAFEQRVGPSRVLRVATDDVPAVGAALREADVEAATQSTAELAAAVDGHVFVLIGALIALAVVMAVVGVLGLAAATGTGVIERTREFAVMRAIGASPSTVTRIVLGETVVVGLLSWVVAAVLAVPLSWAIGSLLGSLAFRLPLTLTISPLALALWLVIAVAGSALAGTAPARRASSLTVRQALAYV